jgi:carboxylate-amine ligase
VLRSWDEYTGLVSQLQTAGFIKSHHELWWDVRPNAEYGTVEVRICDMPPDLPSVLALTALIQCLVHGISRETDEVLAESEYDSVILRQNRWRAYRYGLGAELVEPATLEVVPARRAVERLVRRLRAVASGLGCGRYLESLLEAASLLNGSERQLALFEQTGDLAAVVRQLVAESTLVSPGRSRDSRRVSRPVPGGYEATPFHSTAPAGIPAA